MFLLLGLHHFFVPKILPIEQSNVHNLKDLVALLVAQSFDEYGNRAPSNKTFLIFPLHFALDAYVLHRLTTVIAMPQSHKWLTLSPNGLLSLVVIALSDSHF
jgi:hypothetical protein